MSDSTDALVGISSIMEVRSSRLQLEKSIFVGAAEAAQPKGRHTNPVGLSRVSLMNIGTLRYHEVPEFLARISWR